MAAAVLNIPLGAPKRRGIDFTANLEEALGATTKGRCANFLRTAFIESISSPTRYDIVKAHCSLDIANRQRYSFHFTQRALKGDIVI